MIDADGRTEIDLDFPDGEFPPVALGIVQSWLVESKEASFIMSEAMKRLIEISMGGTKFRREHELN